ncbi:MAG: hypothetical protein HFE78_05170 [Clostridiales bacterium]|nr:hypothetical protein [Clostridiales bacterium]
MKKILFFELLMLIIMTFTACSEKTYLFKNSVDEIESIEIVSAENSLEYTVIKTLSEPERKDFLEQFQIIKFDRYYVGDPMSVNGNAVKTTYQDGNYEMICYYWAEYVKDGEIYFIRKSCDEKVFNELLNRFLE